MRDSRSPGRRKATKLAFLFCLQPAAIGPAAGLAGSHRHVVEQTPPKRRSRRRPGREFYDARSTNAPPHRSPRRIGLCPPQSGRRDHCAGQPGQPGALYHDGGRVERPALEPGSGWPRPNEPGLQCLVSVVGWGGTQITEHLLRWNLTEDGKPLPLQLKSRNFRPDKVVEVDTAEGLELTVTAAWPARNALAVEFALANQTAKPRTVELSFDYPGKGQQAGLERPLSGRQVRQPRKRARRLLVDALRAQRARPQRPLGPRLRGRDERRHDAGAGLPCRPLAAQTSRWSPTARRASSSRWVSAATAGWPAKHSTRPRQDRQGLDLGRGDRALAGDFPQGPAAGREDIADRRNTSGCTPTRSPHSSSLCIRGEGGYTGTKCIPYTTKHGLAIAVLLGHVVHLRGLAGVRSRRWPRRPSCASPRTPGRAAACRARSATATAPARGRRRS